MSADIRTPTSIHRIRLVPRPRLWMWLIWGGWLLLLLGPQANRVPYPANEAFSDLVVAHFPQILYLRRALTHWHTLPLWAPTYYSGYPFYADPLSGLWYLPGWLGVVLPLPWGVTLTVGLHWLLSAWGMYAFLRALGRKEQGAFLAALAWLGFGKIWAHWAGGHLTLMYAVAWTPWLLFVSERRGRLLRPGVVLALIFLADPRWVVYAGGVWAAWEAKKHWREGRVLTRIWLTEGFIAGLLAAPLALPLLHYTHLSTRASLTAQDVLLFSLPWSRVLGVVAPIGGMTEWVTYLGAGAVLLASAAWLRGRARFWAAVALTALVWALGEHIPGLRWLSYLPGISWLRVPPRGLFLLGFAVAVAVSAGWETLAVPWPLPWQKRRNLLWFAIIVLGFSATLLSGLLIGDTFMAASSAFWLAAGLVAWRTHPHRSYALWAWAFVMAVDLLAFDAHLVVPRDFAPLLQPAPVLEEAASQTQSPFRFYTPSCSIPQQVAAAQGWELANGVDPLVLASYIDFMKKASGLWWDAYTVVVPPLDPDNLFANRQAVPRADLLGLLNVVYVVAEFPLPERADFTLWAQQDGLWVYRNPQARPRAWVEQGNGWRPVDALQWAPNRITITASGPGDLVLSEMAYPGWQVSVDGKPVEAQTAYQVFRSVPLEAGAHTVVWRFRPWDLIFGLLAALVGWLWLLVGPAGLKAVLEGGR